MAFHNWVTVLVGGFLCGCVYGTVLIWGNISVYVIAYLRHEANSDLTLYDGVMVNSLTLSLFMFSEPMGSKMILLVNPLLTEALGAFLLVGGLFCSAFVKNLSELCITYGVMLGTGLGLMYCYPLKCAIEWNTERKGLVGGVISSGLGIGGCVWGQLATAFLNSSNYPTGSQGEELPESVYKKVPSLFLLLSAIHATVLLIAFFFFVRKPPFRVSRESANFSFSHTAKRLEFWVLWLVFICLSISGTFTSAMFREVGQGLQDSKLSLVGSLALLFDSVLQPLFGVLIDKTSSQVSLVLIQFGMFLFVLTYWFVTQVSFVLFGIWTVAIMALYGGVIPTMINLAADAFGVRNSSVGFAMLESCEGVGALVQIPVSLVLVDLVGILGVYCILAVLVLLSILTFFIFRHKLAKRKLEEEESLY